MKQWTYTGLKNLVESVRMRLPIPGIRIGTKRSALPIIQGGMGVAVSLSSLSSAVAEAGGIGVIAANGIGMIEPDYFRHGREANVRALRSEIRKAREKTDGIIGVNIMVALQDFGELLAVAIEEKVDLVILGAGLPVKNIPVKQMRAAGVQAVPIVSSRRAAKLIFSMWERIYHDVPDAVIVEGPKAGGHLGIPEEQLDDEAFALETVIPQVAEEVRRYESSFSKSIPVIAAGGIFTGKDIYDIMKLGASGVQMGTRFAATVECDADIRFKQALVACRKEDIGIIKSPVGLPGRAIVNEFLLSAAAQKRRFSCPWRCLAGCQAEEANYCISMALNNARKGNLKSGFVFVGSNAPRIRSILTTVQLLAELKQGYLKALFADKRQILTETAERFSRLKRDYVHTELSLQQLKTRFAQGTAVREEAAKLSRLLMKIRDDMTRCLSAGFNLPASTLSG